MKKFWFVIVALMLLDNEIVSLAALTVAMLLFIANIINEREVMRQ